MSRFGARGTGMAVDTVVLDALLDDTSTGVPAGGYAEVERVLTLLRAPAMPIELAGEAQAVTAFTAARERAIRRRAAFPLTATSGCRPARVAVLVATALVALGGTAYAASQGSLPGPFQHMAHDALDRVGIDVPTGGDTPPAGAIDAGTLTGRDGAPADSANGARPAATSAGDPSSGTPTSGAGSSDNGNSGADNGSSSTAPGQSGGGQGQSASAPGQTGDTPGHSGTTPGQGGTPPGQGGTPPGQGGTPPGQGGTPPGQGGTPPGQAKK